MTEILFLDIKSTPLSNYIKRFLPFALIVLLLFVGVPLYDGFEETDLYLIIPFILLLIYQAIVQYINAKRYLYKVELSAENIMLTVVDMNGKEEVLIFTKDKSLEIKLKEFLPSFNTIGISVLVMTFIQNGKTYKQYPVGKWDSSMLREVLYKLQKLGFAVNSDIPISPAYADRWKK